MNNKSIKVRDFSLDNLRFFLIFSVVFAHLLEVCKPFKGDWLIYLFIYTFHMPAFIFMFGYNVKYSIKRIICRWCIPYVIFQSIYILFTSRNFQYTTPYWLLWYMLACIFYQLLIPLYDTPDNSRQILSLLCAFVIALLVGFVDFISYYLSLSRFFVFQLWFLMGYYCKKNGTIEVLLSQNKLRFSLLFVSMTVIGLSVLLLFWGNVPKGLLYGSYSYSNCGSTMWMRMIAFLISFCWIIFLFIGLKPLLNKRITFVTMIGQNTFPIFLLHGFLVKGIPIYWSGLLDSPCRVILVTCMILVLLGNKLVDRLIYYFSFMWIEKIEYS